jgi:hypothetical protein
MTAKKNSAKQPRLDRYGKLWCRFFEPLILLETLGKTRGQSSLRSQDYRPSRRLLDSLAYICDREKGGATTSAIALEDQEKCYCFKFACNDTSKADSTVKFLIRTLEEAKSIVKGKQDQGSDEVDAFIENCVNFSRKRITKERKLLLRAIKSCEEKLSKGLRWLKHSQWQIKA